MIEGWKAPLDGRADGAQHEDEREIEVAHQGPSYHARVLVLPRDVQRDRVHYPLDGELMYLLLKY